MRNRTMFGTLYMFEDADFFDRNRYIYIYMPDETFVYEIFAAVEYPDDNLMKCCDYTDPENLANLINEIMSLHGRHDCIRKETQADEGSIRIPLLFHNGPPHPAA